MNSWKRFGKTLLTFAVFMFSIAFLRGNLKIGNYGAISSYGVIGLLSIFLLSALTLLGAFRRELRTYSISSFLYLLFMLRFYIFFLKKSPMFPFVYLVYGHTKYIEINGHSNPVLFGYQSWPGIMYLGAFLDRVTEIGIYIMTVTRVIFLVVIALSIYLILRYVSNFKNALIGTFFSLTAIYGLYYYVPMSLAISLEFLGVYLVLRSIFSEDRKVLLLLFIITPSIIISHLLTTLIFITTLLAFMALSSMESKRRTKLLAYYLAFSFILLFLWIFSQEYTTVLLRRFYDTSNFILLFTKKFLMALYTTKHRAVSALAGVTPHAKVLRIKMYYMYLTLGIISLMLFSGAFDLLKRIKSLNETARFLFASILLILPLYMIIIPAVIGPYGPYGEIYGRILEFSIWTFGTVIALLFTKRRVMTVIVLTFLIVSPYLYIFATYGNAQYDYVSPNELSGVAYTSSHIRSSVYSFQNPVWGIKQQYFMGKWKVFKISAISDEVVSKTPYIVFSSRMSDGAYFFTGKTFEVKYLRVMSDIIYSSKDEMTDITSFFEIFIWR
ncbi:hypothetical protein [Thermococcus barophilus]|uniref:Glycosyltransferase RgtA/B/C/D-like domain-containing protein n=1 Tax=Thermococcus barophilus TaxID=55802 RepID=A0A0S1XEZ6_THEBA|nr:hypothetical protein [Thermococcus barophilus]ALM76394.1 membrane hypothetical protein [Thermococcus barophilus]